MRRLDVSVGIPPPHSARPSRLLPSLLRRLASIECLLLLAVLLTVAAASLRERLTTRVLVFGAADAWKSYDSYTYDDSSNAGKSSALFDARHPLSWQCVLRMAYQWPYCGFGLTFDREHQGRGIDLSRYQRLRLRLTYHGSGKLFRISLKDHDRRYASLASPSDKANQIVWPIHNGEQTIDVPLSDFVVAEWWKAETRAPPALAQPSFTNVIALEFISGTDAVLGRQQFQVDDISFERETVSPEWFYSTIAALWIILTSFLISRNQRQFRSINRSAHEAVRRSEELYRSILNASTDTIVLFDGDGYAQLVNASGVSAMEIDVADRIVGKHWRRIWRGPSAVVHEAMEKAAEGQASRFQAYCATAKGTPKWWDVAVVPLSSDGMPQGTLTISRDVTDERNRTEQLKWTSEHDALTQLPNRRAFQARLQGAALRAMEADRQIGLLLIDLDHFKHINDTLGHAAGDELMKKVGERFRKGIRNADFVARIGGDEFAVLVEPVPSETALLKIGEHLHSLIRKPMRVAGREIRASASIGGATFPANATSADDLFKNADTALYSLKQEGRGGVRLFNSHMIEEAERSASQLRLARKAVTHKTVVAVYQPKFDVATGSLAGFESLLRWRHPRKGLQLPATVEQAFAEYELAAKIGGLMQRSVANDIRSWSQSDIEVGRVAINAAPAEFLRDDYAEGLLSVIDECGISAKSIEIEITEHAFLGRAKDYVARALEVLKQAGVTIALDDFGTGASSLSHLRDFPVDVVKIDRSFIQQMTADEEIAAIVVAVVNLARSLSITAVAEGVDSLAQLDILRAVGCHLAQGHLFSEPLERDAVSAFVSAPQRTAA